MSDKPQSFEESVIFILDELIHAGSRICTPEQRKESADRMVATLERLKVVYGLPAGRGDTPEATGLLREADELT